MGESLNLYIYDESTNFCYMRTKLLSLLNCAQVASPLNLIFPLPVVYIFIVFSLKLTDKRLFKKRTFTQLRTSKLKTSR